MTRKTTVRGIAAASALALAVAIPVAAEANWFTSTWHKAKHAASHAANTVKHGAEHAASTVKHGAETAAKGIQKGAEAAGKGIQTAATDTGKAFEAGAKLTAKEIEDGAKIAAEEMKKLGGQLTRITGTCETAIRKIGHDVGPAMPPIPIGIPQLTSSKCEVAQTSGFMCGIFPYANTIMRSIAEGAHSVKVLAGHVGHAYNSRYCSHISKIDPDRGLCAFFVGLASEAAESGECLADIGRELIKHKSNSAPHFDETEVCTVAGEFEFGFVADKVAVAGAAEEYQKSVKFAQILRTVLNAKSLAADFTSHIPSCKAARKG